MKYNYALAEQVIREIVPDVVRVQGPTTAETRNIEDGEIEFIGRYQGRKYFMLLTLPPPELTELEQREVITWLISGELDRLGIN